jgi:prevent-host-death family protein
VQIVYFVQIQAVKILSLSEFRAHASEMVDCVQRGETVRILRHGKPVAELVPVSAASEPALPRWKHPATPFPIRPSTELPLARELILAREQGGL